MHAKEIASTATISIVLFNYFCILVVQLKCICIFVKNKYYNYVHRKPVKENRYYRIIHT